MSPSCETSGEKFWLAQTAFAQDPRLVGDPGSGREGRAGLGWAGCLWWGLLWPVLGGLQWRSSKRREGGSVNPHPSPVPKGLQDLQCPRLLVRVCTSPVMRVPVSGCVSMHVCACPCVGLCAFVSVLVHVQACPHLCVHPYVLISARVCVHTYKCICVGVHAWAHISVYGSMHIQVCPCLCASIPVSPRL